MLVLAAVCLAVVLATVAIVQWRTNQEDGNAAAYAYITGQELVIVRGDKEVTRVSRIFDEADATQRKLVWTNSGDYVAFLSDAGLRVGDSALLELIFVNTHTGTEGRIPCESCDDFAAVGDNDIILATYNTEQGSRVLKVDLESPGMTKQVDIPSDNRSGYLRSFIATTRDFVVTRQSIQVGSSSFADKVEVVGVEGSSKAYSGFFSSATAATMSSGGHGATAAIAAGTNPGLCETDLHITLLDTNGGETKTDTSAAEPPGGKPGGTHVEDLWWGLDGHFHATIISWTCDLTKSSEVEKQVPASPAALWKLDGQKWVKEDLSPVAMVRQLDEDTRIVLVIPDCIGGTTHDNPQVYCNSGRLYRDDEGQQAPIADGVISISTPPA
jgi:hypothetical protein